MTTYRGLEALVRKTIVTAIDDKQPGLGGIRFDNDLVGRIMKQLSSADRLNAAVAVCETRLSGGRARGPIVPIA